MNGIFIMKGMSLNVRDLKISFDDQGNIVDSNLRVEVGYDACLAWAEIALDQRQAALLRMDERRAIWASDGSDEDKAKSLEREFAASMQAVVAAVTCIDALYDQIVPHAPIDQSTIDSWKRNRTARHTQIAETLKVAFRVGPKSTKLLKELLMGMYLLRDVAVHPSSAAQPPRQHPELPSQTEWRFTSFRGDVADVFVCSAIGLLWDLTQFPRYRTDALKKLMGEMEGKLRHLLPEGKPQAAIPTVEFFVPPRWKATFAKESDGFAIVSNWKKRFLAALKKTYSG